MLVLKEAEPFLGGSRPHRLNVGYRHARGVDSSRPSRMVATFSSCSELEPVVHWN